MNDWTAWALLFMLYREEFPVLSDCMPLYGMSMEEYETSELVTFVNLARIEVAKRTGTGPNIQVNVRITKTLRIFLGDKELKMRPMAKSILLLFLSHPEGIPLKTIGNYRSELSFYYGKLSRSADKDLIAGRVDKIEDIFNNELNVNIARINTAIEKLVGDQMSALYRIRGGAGKRKSIPLASSAVTWE